MLSLRVLLADPRPVWRLGVRAALGPDVAVSDAATTDEALAALPEADVVVLGAPLATSVAACAAGARLLVVAPPDEALTSRLHAHGVAGFLPETSGSELIREAAEAVARGETRWYTAPASAPALSAREAEVVRHLAQGRSNGEIAEVLGLSASTVRTHLANASAKVGARTAREAIAWAWRSGVARETK